MKKTYVRSSFIPKQIFVSVFILLLFKLVPGALAQDKIEANEWTYQIPKSRFYPSHSVRWLSEGLSLGDFQLKSTSASLTEELKGRNYAESIRILANRAVEQKNSLRRVRSEIQASFESLRENAAEARARAANHETFRNIPQDQGNENIGNFDLEELMKCAKKSLPDIKTLIRDEETAATLSPEERYPLLGEIQRTRQKLRTSRVLRNDGFESITCGKFLGNAIFRLPSLVEEAKFLLSILSRQENNERLLLVKSAVAALSPGNLDDESRQVWRHYWHLLGLKAVFGRQALPSMDELKNELRTGLQRQIFAVTGVAQDIYGLNEMTQVGLAFAESKLH